MYSRPEVSTQVGELGYELFVPTESAAHVYEAIVAAGDPLGLVHASLGPRCVSDGGCTKSTKMGACGEAAKRRDRLCAAAKGCISHTSCGDVMRRRECACVWDMLHGCIYVSEFVCVSVRAL